MPTLQQVVPSIEILLAVSRPQLAHTLLRVVLNDASPDQLLRQIREDRYQGGLHPQNITGLDLYGTRKREVELVVLEAWNWLISNGLLVQQDLHDFSGFRALSLSGVSFYRDSSGLELAALRRVDKNDLHPDLHGPAIESFWRGSYDSSVFEAMKAVEVRVREASAMADGDLGVNLMRKAFDVKGGPLSDQTILVAERQSVLELFSGAIGAFKNPGSHRYVNYDADTCADLLVFASRLLRMVDKAKQATS